MASGAVNTGPVAPDEAQELTGEVRRPFWSPRPLPETERREVIAGVLQTAFPSRRYYILIALSTTIAAFGLLANSAAVIIGAMIIAPLMGPILGVALGMVTANFALERRALAAELSGVALSIALGYLIGLYPLNPGISTEMLARTSPTVLDLGIAIASGLAGGYACMNRKVSSALAGVAISVALVPPLATCGLLLAMESPERSMGALLLFLANYFCIQTAAALVFWIYRLERREAITEMGVWRYRMRFAPSFLAVGAMGWFMTGTLSGIVRDHDLETRLNTTLSEQIAKRTGGRLDRILQRSESPSGYLVVASALTPKVFDAQQVKQIEGALRESIRQDLVLVLRSVVSQDMDHSGRVYLSAAEREQAIKSSEAAEFLRKARSVLSDKLSTFEGATLESIERVDQGELVVLVSAVSTPIALTAEQVSEAEDALVEALDQPIRLIIRNVLTKVYDRSGELYSPLPEQEAPDPELVALRSRIYRVLRLRMTTAPARRLVLLDVRRSGAALVASATVEAIEPVRPSEVAAIESDLRQHVDPSIRLLIRTELVTNAGSTGWRIE